MTIFNLYIDISGRDHRNMTKLFAFVDEKQCRIIFEIIDNFLHDLYLHELIVNYSVHIERKEHDEIDDSLTADVVEVVRCNDCKYWETSWKTRTEFHYYCPMIDCITGCDFFCPYGERKDT